MRKQLFLYAAGLAVLLGTAPLATANDDKAPGTPKTVTGCVTAATDGKSFTLTETSKDPQTPGKTWALLSTPGVDLSKYANHKVEITGSSEAKGEASMDQPATAGTPAAGANLKFKVKSVKDISNSCQ